MKILILFFTLFAVGNIQAQNVTVPAFIRDSLDNYVNRALKEWDIPGAAVCIVKDGKVVVMKGYGVKEAGGHDPVDENTLFNIGSVSKTFTGTALAMLESEKLPAGIPAFSLNDRVRKWLPGFSLYVTPAGEHAIIRDLLCHRLGFDGLQGTFSLWESNFSRHQVIERMAFMKPSYPFRSAWGYSNAAFVAAGEIIPAATGKTYAEFLKEKIFVPLAMNRTVASDTAWQAAINKSKAHFIINDTIKPMPYVRLEHLTAAGGVSSSVSDLSHWVLMELNKGQYNGKQVVPAAVIRETWSPHTIMGEGHNLYNTGHFLSYGLGWFTQEYNGYQMLAHTGKVDGFISAVTLVPEKNLGIIVLTNSDDNNFPRALFWEVTDAWLGLPFRNYSKVYLDMAKKRRNAFKQAYRKMSDSVSMKPATALRLEDYAGKYTDSLYGDAEIVVENKTIRMKLSHHPTLTIKLEPLGGNRFYTTFNLPAFTPVVTAFTLNDKKPGSFRFELVGPGSMEQLAFIRQ